MDYSPRGSSVRELFLARILEWFAISSSRGSSQPRDRTWVLRRSFYCWATGGMHACVYVCRKSLKGYKTKCCQLLPLNDRIKGFFFLMIFSSSESWSKAVALLCWPVDVSYGGDARVCAISENHFSQETWEIAFFFKWFLSSKIWVHGGKFGQLTIFVLRNWLFKASLGGISVVLDYYILHI